MLDKDKKITWVVKVLQKDVIRGAADERLVLTTVLCRKLTGLYTSLGKLPTTRSGGVKIEGDPKTWAEKNPVEYKKSEVHKKILVTRERSQL